jgi:hypothetical protein
MTECIFCKGTELTYNSLVADSHCGDCGEWQEGEYINN